MDLKSVEAFLDLITNPKKFEGYLKSIKEEKDRLTEVIETVGKAAEIDNLKRDAAMLKEEAIKKISEAEEKAKDIVNKAESVRDSLTSELREKIDLAERAKAEAEAIYVESEAKVRDFIGREKEMSKKEREISEKESKLKKEQKEFNEKAAKLRSIVG